MLLYQSSIGQNWMSFLKTRYLYPETCMSIEIFFYDAQQKKSAEKIRGEWSSPFRLTFQGTSDLNKKNEITFCSLTPLDFSNKIASLFDTTQKKQPIIFDMIGSEADWITQTAEQLKKKGFKDILLHSFSTEAKNHEEIFIEYNDDPDIDNDLTLIKYPEYTINALLYQSFLLAQKETVFDKNPALFLKSRASITECEKELNKTILQTSYRLPITNIRHYFDHRKEEKISSRYTTLTLDKPTISLTPVNKQKYEEKKIQLDNLLKTFTPKTSDVHEIENTLNHFLYLLNLRYPSKKSNDNSLYYESKVLFLDSAIDDVMKTLDAKQTNQIKGDKNSIHLLESLLNENRFYSLLYNISERSTNALLNDAIAFFDSAIKTLSLLKEKNSLSLEKKLSKSASLFSPSLLKQATRLLTDPENKPYSKNFKNKR